ncbi:MAG: hypothetical protein ABI597_13995 [Gammaproteobacteria bacterium]
MKICYKSGSGNAPNSTVDFNDVLKAIGQSKNSGDKIFDFSGSDFRELPSDKLGKLFEALGCVSQPYLLRMNGCKFNETNQEYVSQLALGFSSTPNLIGIELKNSFCLEQTICDVAISLRRNTKLESINIDLQKVASDDDAKNAIENLKRHDTAIVTIYGLVSQKSNDSQFKFFQSSDSVAPDSADEQNQARALPKQKNN